MVGKTFADVPMQGYHEIGCVVLIDPCGFAMAHLVRLLMIVNISASLVFPGQARGAPPVNVAAQKPGPQDMYLPLVFGAPSPVGTYDCWHMEWWQTWRTEIVTLTMDGISQYQPMNWSPPLVYTGTWVYTPTTDEVGLTGFAWVTVTYMAPDRLFASRFVGSPDPFEIAVDCRRLS